MNTSFFFYDLETSGTFASRDRIMQFGGQRTDLSLKPIGKPVNYAIKLSADTLPDPSAILLNGLSVLDNQASGISEAEFADIFNNQIAIPGTIFTGFNNLRFDDEFMRYLNYRNFFDAYAWHWRDSRSRWDLLDVIRMTRALRPDNINWPVEDSKPSNKLSLLTEANKLKHAHAHDALSDALATIEVAKLIKSSSPKIFDYLLSLRSKQRLIETVSKSDSLIYTSSHYSSDYLHTTVVAVIEVDKDMGSALVFDLREDVKQFLDLSIDQLSELWRYDPDQPRPRLPVKTMKLNRCPAIAPLNVLNDDNIKALHLDMSDIEKNLKLIISNKQQFGAKLKQVAIKLDKQRDDKRKSDPRIPSVDERLYDSFITSSDALQLPKARQVASNDQLTRPKFKDKRLVAIYELYRARNYPLKLTPEESSAWQQYVRDKLFEGGNDSQFSKFTGNLILLQTQHKADPNKQKLLEDLNVYAQTILNDYAADWPAAGV